MRAQVQRVQKFVGNRQLPRALRDDVMRHMEATRSVASDPDAGEIFPRLSHILQARLLALGCRSHQMSSACFCKAGSLHPCGLHTHGA